ncbi:MAG: glycerol-3-phosphate 1-O-acyltransferase PlsY [Clostridia bacterium]|nr:glycerol-3-phosphate 1-O-acyltransferase PlsY [Clostridia bacterium]
MIGEGVFSVWLALAAAAAGYLCGNLQTSLLISRLYYHDDIRRHGSGNAGSTNMVRVFGFKPGILTFAGDFLKAVAGVLLGRLIMGPLGGFIAALFVVVGHCWPAFAGFRGGKGVASTFGAAVMIFPLGGLIGIAVGGLMLAIFKKVSLMSLCGVLAFLISVLIFRLSELPLVILSALLTLIVYIRHIDNIRRLLRREEKPLRNS